VHAFDAQILSPEEVRRRFAWAERRGLRRWLWPDVSPQAWRAAMAQIAAVTRRLLASQRTEILDGEPLAFSVAGYVSGMGPLLGYWMEEGRLAASERIAPVLKLHLEHNKARLDLLQSEAVHVVDRLAEAGIQATVLKGMHTAFVYFPVAAARPLSDVDLLVAPADLPAAEETLAREGYVGHLRHRDPYQCDWMRPGVSPEPRTLVHVHADDPWAIDLQTTLDRTFAPGTVVRLDTLLDRRSLAPWTPAREASVLPQPLLTLQLASHAAQQAVNLSLIRLVELVLVIRKDLASGAFSWSAAETAAKACGPGYFYPAFAACEKLVPGTIPEHVLALCAAEAPRRVRRYVETRDAHLLQPVDRHSLAASTLWAGGAAGLLRQVIDPGYGSRSLARILPAYLHRMRALGHLFR
jgi:hypothetical protein